MSKARELADFVAAGNPLADGSIDVSEVTGAAPTASPTFTGDAIFDTDTLAVDSTNNRVGIGTSSPSQKLHIEGAGNQFILLNNSTTNDGFYFKAGAGASSIQTNGGSNVMNFFTSGTERMRINSSGNVGIGATSPSTKVDINNGTSDSLLTLTTNSFGGAARTGVNFQVNGFANTPSGQIAVIGDNNYSGNMVFSVANSGTTNPLAERMRIDSSGHLLVGTTDNAVWNDTSGTGGINARSDGILAAARNGGEPLLLNRIGTDGELIKFKKNGSDVGSIGNIGSAPVFRNVNQDGISLLTDDGQAKLVSTNSSGLADNDGDIGAASYRWDDIYATNGTIQTSDRNEKQDIASLTDAEMTAAKAISKLFKTFKWNDAVTEKGDAARTHTGVIAQDVEQAMTDAGLNAGDYAFFISTTWWETQTEVPAVEADEENGVEAQEAYTRTDTYHTLEEAPEGAIERNRKGIRYPQLLSFIGAATEQRLASIEGRLDALENA